MQKAVSDSLGPVDFSVRLVNFVFHLHETFEVEHLWNFKLQSNLVKYRPVFSGANLKVITWDSTILHVRMLIK